MATHYEVQIEIDVAQTPKSLIMMKRTHIFAATTTSNVQVMKLTGLFTGYKYQFKVRAIVKASVSYNMTSDWSTLKSIKIG